VSDLRVGLPTQSGVQIVEYLVTLLILVEEQDLFYLGEYLFKKLNIIYFMDISKAKDILDYWFSNDPYTPNYDKWFLKSQDYDNEIKLKFGNLLKQAEQGKGFAWLNTKDSYIAYIILLDQFSRHIYRGTGESFKNDNAAIIFLEMGWNLYENHVFFYALHA